MCGISFISWFQSTEFFLHEILRLSFEQRTLGSKCETPLEHFPAIFFKPETASIEKVHFENKHEGNTSFEMPQEFPTYRVVHLKMVFLNSIL